VDEHVLATVFTLDEAEALLAVEELDDTLAGADDLGRHAAAARAAEAATAAATWAAAEAATIATAKAAAISTTEAATIAAAEEIGRASCRERVS
jgi:2-keto-3-deoxy-L-rhamnonate aldolase RhmA